MCSIIADTDYHRFAIGSSSVPTAARSGLNEIHLVSYSEDANRIDTDLAFSLEYKNGSEAGNTLAGYEVSALSSSPYNRGTLIAAVASTNGRDTDCNKLVFYQIQERAAPVTILDSSPTMREDGDEEGKDQ